jgi:transcriptional regulator with XRE-family HTH domain
MGRSWDDFESLVKTMNTKKDFERLEVAADFSAKLIKARLRKNYTQSELAKRAGLKQSAIARIENNGSLPRIDTAYKIARALESEINFYPINCEENTSVEIKELTEKLSNIEKMIESLTNEIKIFNQTVQYRNKILKPISSKGLRKKQKSYRQHLMIGQNTPEHPSGYLSTLII